MSQLFTADINAVRNGEEIDFHVIVKILPTSLWHQKFAADAHLFEKEIDMYTTVLPAMIEYQTQDGPKILPPFPKCYYGKFDGVNGVLVLENLRFRGYKGLDLKIGLNLNETQAVMKTFAEFHALGYNLQKQTGSKMRELFPSIFKRNMEGVEPLWEHSLDTSLKVLKNMEEGERFVENIEQCAGRVMKLMTEVWNSRSFPTICHGDPWINNLMMRQDGEKVDVILLDLQMVYLGTGAADVGEILTSSSQAKIQIQNQDDVMKTYHKTFIDNLEVLNISNDFTFEEFQNEYKECFFAGFLRGISAALMFGLVDKEEFAEMLEDLKEEEDTETLKEAYSNRTGDKITIKVEELRDRFLHVVKCAVDNKILTR